MSRALKYTKPLVFLHGFPLDKRMWRQQIEKLSPHVRALAINLGRFGTKTPPGETKTSIKAMADEVACFLDEGNITDPVALCGLSMGGYVALRFAHDYPSRLDKLILANTRSLPDNEAARAKRNDLRKRLAEGERQQVLKELMKPMLVSGSPAAKEMQHIADEQSTEIIRSALEALRDREDATPWLSEIKVPTLVISGAKDTVIPSSEGAEMAKKIPSGQFAELPDAAHLSNVDRPEAFNKLILDFLTTRGG
ncbi:3-oxoadipate enol-lactonase 2-like [Paramacrobiotus metropolitanus]|uniref:3-oxoadipate enol-lactonase 2-like n=1 Tax=Paramacrobiotus metropolitanus TaxID=2943436 RepID=UPI002445B613|nr:3-oxoadipate enol-lactonase 2-like [Paramacrobiotus metropolitanus]